MRDTLQAIVDRVAKGLKFHGAIEVRMKPSNPNNPWDMDSTPLPVPVIRFCPEAWAFFSLEELESAICHEVGHLVDPKIAEASMNWMVYNVRPSRTMSRAAELRADIYAAKHGYGPGLIAGLTRYQAAIDEQDASGLFSKMSWDDSTHPATVDRIAAIESTMASSVKVATA